MRKMLLIAAAAALLAPAAALATKPPTKPSHPSQAKNDSHPAPTVLYILRGTLMATYDTSNPPKLTAIAITVKSASRHGKALKTKTLTFTVGPNTRVVLHKHAQISIGSPYDRGIVKVRVAKNFDFTAADALTTFQANASLKQVIDQGKYPNNGQGQNNSQSSKFLYILRGTVHSVDPGGTPPTIAIDVTGANHYAKMLKDASPLTFTIGSKVVYQKGTSAITSGDHVIVKVVGPKALNATPPLLTGTTKQIIDQGQ